MDFVINISDEAYLPYSMLPDFILNNRQDLNEIERLHFLTISIYCTCEPENL
ncbi:Uncharacterised protein [Neisseria zoodegmatis]|uniref:Uncharacterized protein n=1 Tax=Neisseria zoodegmatis TaxID=326523 RepID=A0A378WRW7_9NEIS|nr:Uncharacterised protein [Neisseria zoodegmatis]